MKEQTIDSGRTIPECHIPIAQNWRPSWHCCPLVSETSTSVVLPGGGLTCCHLVGEKPMTVTWHLVREKHMTVTGHLVGEKPMTVTWHLVGEKHMTVTWHLMGEKHMTVTWHLVGENTCQWPDTWWIHKKLNINQGLRGTIGHYMFW